MRAGKIVPVHNEEHLGRAELTNRLDGPLPKIVPAESGAPKKLSNIIE